MKKTIVKIAMIIIIVLQVVTILGHAAIFGYEWQSFFSDLYNKGMIVILSIAILWLSNDK